MKLDNLLFFITMGIIAFYGSVYNNEWAIAAIEFYCYLMIFICFLAVYFIDFTDKGDEYIKKKKLSDSYGTLRQRIEYVFTILMAALMINYAHVMIGVMLMIPIFANEYVARRIINTNK